MNPTDTPRTDAEASDGWSGDAVCVSAEFARELERELAAMKIRAEQAESDLYLLGEKHRRLLDSF